MSVTLTCALQAWGPGIGDDNPIGWATVVVYALAAVASARRALQPVTGRERMFWTGAAALLALLAVNKQLDLQSLLTAIGRCHAQLTGWYEDRSRIQFWFVVGAVTLCTAGFAALVLLLRGLFGRLWLALLGLGLVSVFVLVRAASIHNMDGLLRSAVLGLRMNWLLELPGPILVLLAASRDPGHR